MKKFLTLLVALIANYGFASAQCDALFDWEKGTMVEMTQYNKKGKEEGKQIIEVTDVTGSGDNVTYAVKFIYLDKKGKEEVSMESEIVCEDGNFVMKPNDMFRDQMASMQQAEGIEVKFVGDDIMMPANMKEGDSFDDLNYEVVMEADDSNPAAALLGSNKIVFAVTDRKVVGSEKVTTPAGTFDCLVLTQATISTMEVMGMKRATKGSTKEFLSKDGHGNVRSEQYDKNGKLVSYSELTDFKNID